MGKNALHSVTLIKMTVTRFMGTGSFLLGKTFRDYLKNVILLIKK
jgi:hypothetical protein